MVNDYEKAIGIWTHKIGEIEHKIIPKEGDNINIAKIMNKAKTNGIDWLYGEFNTSYYEMVVRETPIEDEKKQGQLRLWIEKNQVQIQKDMLITFGWQTKEQQEKMENLDGDVLKKLINA